MSVKMFSSKFLSGEYAFQYYTSVEMIMGSRFNIQTTFFKKIQYLIKKRVYLNEIYCKMLKKWLFQFLFNNKRQKAVLKNTILFRYFEPSFKLR